MRVWRNRAARASEVVDPTTTDVDLVDAAREDRLAFGPLYERYRDDLLRYCFYCLGDWDDAADATQQVFTNAIAALPRFTDRGDSFRSWLFRIAHNEVLARQQRRGRRPQRPLLDAAEVIDGGPSPEELAIAADDHQRLWLLLALLPLEQRKVCELRLAGLRDQEIATILGKREGAVRTAQSRAIVHLRALLGITLTRTGGSHD